MDNNTYNFCAECAFEMDCLCPLRYTDALCCGGFICPEDKEQEEQP